MKKVVRLILIFIFIGNAFTIKAQNLVPNPSFELYDTCPNSIGQIYHSTSWIQPTTGSSDYFNQCYDTTIGDNYGEVPNNYYGYQNAKGVGVAYSGVFACNYTGSSSPTYREYLQTQLSSPLVMNQTYFVSVYVSLSDSSRYETDGFGVYFSSSPISRTDFDAFGYVPQVENTSGSFLSTKTNWMKISGAFIALGGEQYVTIGNFKNDSNTDTVRVIANLSSNTDYNGAYYYVEDVCVSTDSMTCNGTVGIKNITVDPASIFYNSSFKQVVINQLGVYQIQITDLYGNIRSMQKLQGYQSIDVSAYPSGCYIVVFNNQNGSSSKKIIINH